MTNTTKPWLLVGFACFLLCPPSTTHSSPIRGNGREAASYRELCPHQSIAQLIKTSPVIIKALGAHIFTGDDDNDLSTSQIVQQNNFFAASAKHVVAPSVSVPARSTTASPSSATKIHSTTTITPWHIKNTMQVKSVDDVDGHKKVNAIFPSSPTATITDAGAASLLITLTPETIYKGASLLKMGRSTDSVFSDASNSRSSSGISNYSAFDDISSSNGNGGVSSRSNGPGSSQYDGQLNATLQPLACFDSNLLRILPTELIIFGQLITAQQQQQLQQQQKRLYSDVQLDGQQLPQTDILHISINGLHLWSPLFENHIWKHLGWDNWSDFTFCSVTCGKGVQQRFRRCLLDNPMINLNAISANDEYEEDDVITDGDANFTTSNNTTVVNKKNVYDKMKSETAYPSSVSRKTDDSNANNSNTNSSNERTRKQSHSEMGYIVDSDIKNDNAIQKQQRLHQHWVKAKAIKKNGSGGADGQQIEVDDIDVVVNNIDDDDDDDDDEGDDNNYNNGSDGDIMRVSENTINESDNNDKEHYNLQHRKGRKSTKSISTIFCEGYNIEQRNCNTFECSDDISDLLTFYREFPTIEDTDAEVPVSASVNATQIAPMTIDSTTTKQNITISSSDVENTVTRTYSQYTTRSSSKHIIIRDTAVGINGNGGSTNSKSNVLSVSSTQSNMGYIRNWHNTLNFTLVLTLRVKNDSKSTATIFSICNATHNLYLESCKDGLRLYLERDNATEMLPVKFNLYDNRWHQVAISVQNGDFISIYIDCSWTNSFVVSKRLYSLPLDADIEIGRGFNGELQQLLVLPDNQERQQCSNKRTSINEVKRYIIDTFIGDYSN